MGRKVYPFVVLFIILFVGTSPTVSASRPWISVGFVSTALSSLLKWFASLSATTKTAISGKPLMQFESGYNVETVFDGSKHGIEPYSVDISQNGELLLLDSLNSNLYKIAMPLSRYSRARLVAGSSEGYSGHVDGKARETRMNRPKSFTVDDKGNIYVADSMNMAIRKVNEIGVSTIAGGNWGRGDHADGSSEDAKLSTDFEVVYIASSCSLLVVDRGKQAIREIQLQFDDCGKQFSSAAAGITVLLGAGFFGYMLALLQRRVGTIVSPRKDAMRTGKVPKRSSNSSLKSTVRSPLISEEGELRQDDRVGSFWKFFVNVLSSITEAIGGLCSTSRNMLQSEQNSHEHQQHQCRRSSLWPLQESFVVPEGDEPPSVDSRTPTPKKSYPFMFKDIEKTHHLRNGCEGDRHYYSNTERELQQQKQHRQERIHPLRHQSSVAQTFYEPSC